MSTTDFNDFLHGVDYIKIRTGIYGWYGPRKFLGI